MKFIKSALISIATALTVATPSLARIEEGTADLIKTLQANGIQVVINGSECNGKAHGSYRFVGVKRQLNLCPGNSVDADDHDTVRHETFHAIQHCVNMARGTHINTPIVTDRTKFMEFVKEYLPYEIAQRIISVYPPSHHSVELEAFAAANAFTAVELKDMFLKACVF